MLPLAKCSPCLFFYKPWAENGFTSLKHCGNKKIQTKENYERDSTRPTKVLVAQACPTLCDSMDCSLPSSSVHEILQARILEWIDVPFSRGSSQSRDWTLVFCIAGRFFTFWATREMRVTDMGIRKGSLGNTRLSRAKQRTVLQA